jgi:hypothetical protein
MVPDKLILVVSFPQVMIWAWAVLAALIGVASLLLVVLARYSYEVTDEHLVIRRWKLGFVPAGTMKIPLEDIESVELLRIGRMLFPGYLRYAASFGLHDFVVLSLKRPRYRLFWRVVLGPEDAAALMNGIIPRTGAKDVTRRAEERPILDRLPLWVADGLMVLAGLLPLALIGISIAAAGGISGRGFLAMMGSDAFLVVSVLVTVYVVSVLLAMAMDAARTAFLMEDPVFYVWLIGIVLLPPLAWVYYLRVWRPRRTGRAPSE